MQTVILIGLIIWSSLEPTQNLALIIGVGLAIAISSATQDITIDALRIEQINKEETSSMAAGAAMAVVGWWTGFKLGGFICLEIAEKLQNSGVEQYWQVTFIFLMAIIVLCNIGLTFIPESNKERFQQMQHLDSSNTNTQSLMNAGYLFAAIGALCYLIGLFFVGMFCIRFIIEFIKESQGGFEEILGIFSTGQWLSIPFVLLGLFLMFFVPKKV